MAMVNDWTSIWAEGWSQSRTVLIPRPATWFRVSALSSTWMCAPARSRKLLLSRVDKICKPNWPGPSLPRLNSRTALSSWTLLAHLASSSTRPFDPCTIRPRGCRGGSRIPPTVVTFVLAQVWILSDFVGFLGCDQLLLTRHGFPQLPSPHVVHELIDEAHPCPSLIIEYPKPHAAVLRLRKSLSAHLSWPNGVQIRHHPKLKTLSTHEVPASALLPYSSIGEFLQASFKLLQVKSLIFSVI